MRPVELFLVCVCAATLVNGSGACILPSERNALDLVAVQEATTPPAVIHAPGNRSSGGRTSWSHEDDLAISMSEEESEDCPDLCVGETHSPFSSVVAYRAAFVLQPGLIAGSRFRVSLTFIRC